MTRAEARAFMRAEAMNYYSEYGQYVETPGQEVHVAQLAARTGHAFTEAAFREALDAIHQYNNIDTNLVNVWDEDGREVAPSDLDWGAAKNYALQKQDEEVRARIDALIPGGKFNE